MWTHPIVVRNEEMRILFPSAHPFVKQGNGDAAAIAAVSPLLAMDAERASQVQQHMEAATISDSTAVLSVVERREKLLADYKLV